MSPIRITPQVPIYMCVNERELSLVLPTTETLIAEKEIFVRPKDRSSDYTIKVKGFRDAPGGIIEGQRLSPGHNLDDLTLTTADDVELSDELGISEVIIDKVIYTAINPQNR